jgi:hypothetical protein
VAGVVGLYIAIGLALRLDPNAYLLLGLPITLIFQRVIARRPVRELWLAVGAPFRLDRAGILIGGALAVVPLTLIAAGVLSGQPWVGGYGIAASFGALPAAYALRAWDSVSWRALVRCLLTGGALGIAIFVLFATLTRGLNLVPRPVESLRVFGLSFLQYLPVMFVMEEVLFRGALDSYLHATDQRRGRLSAVFVSALWGAWHLPVVFPTAGIAALPWLVIYHTALGVPLSFGWRRSGNLAVPGITHAIADAVRNALAA